jgi:thymidylate synthase
LISFGEGEINQIERVVNALRNWRNTPNAALVVHLSSAETDKLKPLGSPCWQFGEFVRGEGGKIDFIVVYRSHDYFGKVLGNLIGLSRLLSYVCKRAGKTPGRIVCHSVYAYFDSSARNMRQLLAGIDGA